VLSGRCDIDWGLSSKQNRLTVENIVEQYLARKAIRIVFYVSGRIFKLWTDRQKRVSVLPVLNVTVAFLSLANIGRLCGKLEQPAFNCTDFCTRMKRIAMAGCLFSFCQDSKDSKALLEMLEGHYNSNVSWIGLKL